MLTEALITPEQEAELLRRLGHKTGTMVPLVERVLGPEPATGNVVRVWDKMDEEAEREGVSIVAATAYRIRRPRTPSKVFVRDFEFNVPVQMLDENGDHIEPIHEGEAA